MKSLGIRELRNNLSRYVRRVESGERIAVTAHGRIVAELGPPAGRNPGRGLTKLDALIAAGLARPPMEFGRLIETWPDLHLPKGTAQDLIDRDREEGD
jgi:antitoxin (DNA-binding transcriptional repressor) of toxin-antitoxin stability system